MSYSFILTKLILRKRYVYTLANQLDYKAMTWQKKLIILYKYVHEAITKMKRACNCIKVKIFKLQHRKLESLVLEMNEFESMQY